MYVSSCFQDPVSSLIFLQLEQIGRRPFKILISLKATRITSLSLIASIRAISFNFFSLEYSFNTKKNIMLFIIIQSESDIPISINFCDLFAYSLNKIGLKYSNKIKDMNNSRTNGT